MEVTKPDYFDRFRCLAGECPDSCCKDWQVQVDEASARRYRALPGALGEELRAALRQEDGETYLTVQDGRCPMWRRDGLCRIQAELGESALCETCRQFPRLTHDYGDFVELGLELSCPEAARWILEEKSCYVTEKNPDGEDPEYDREAMAVLKRTRAQALAILEEADISKALSLLLLYGCQAQGELDGEEERPFDRGSGLGNGQSHGSARRPGGGAGILLRSGNSDGCLAAAAEDAGVWGLGLPDREFAPISGESVLASGGIGLRPLRPGEIHGDFRSGASDSGRRFPGNGSAFFQGN